MQQHGYATRWRLILDRLPEDFSRRGAGLALALAIELLIVILLLTLGLGRSEPEEDTLAVTSFDVSEPPAPSTEQEQAAQSEAASAPAEQSEPLPEVAEPQIAAPTLPSALPLPRFELPPSPAPAPSPTPSSRIGAVVRSDRNYGPADTGSSRGEDSPVVGTAPDGSPLYAARWFREPTNDELSGYLSTASSPGWGLIACKTAPNWRVEDCEIVDEYPSGSGIARATQAAAWQFKVRPPRLGGEYQVGSWVRIRIDYTRTQRQVQY